MKTYNSRKNFPPFMIGLILIVCCVAVTGCGKKGSSQESEYYDVTSETECLYRFDNYETFLGMQYFQGKPVQLRADKEDNIFIVMADGTQKQLLEGLDNAAGIRCYIDNEENLYWWSRDWSASYDGEDASGLCIHKLDAGGKELWQAELEPGALLRDICQLPDGRILLLLQNSAGGVRIVETDPETGALGRVGTVMLESGEYIAGGTEGLLVMDTGVSEGISEINLAVGSAVSSMSFGGSAYSLWTDKEQMEIMDFRMIDSQQIEILWADPKTGLGIQEHLALTRIEKIPIVMRATLFYNELLKKKIAEFNQSNSKYHVVLQYSNEHQNELGQQTALEMVTGGGPDILYGYILAYLHDLAQKGGFEELTPYMEAGGMKKEDYLPLAFLHWNRDEKIYAVRQTVLASYTCINEEILGGRTEPDINMLVDALLAWEGDAAIFNSSSESILCDFFMEGTDNCWGMINWEEGTCDFSGKLFAKMLKAAKRYGYSWEDIYAEKFRDVPSITNSFSCSLTFYKTPEELEAMGLVMAGTLFEDGCHPSLNDMGSLFAINANSSQKEGAWEFIQFIMNEQNQLELAYSQGFLSPVANRRALQASIQHRLKELEENPDWREGWDFSVADLRTGENVEMDFHYAREDYTEERIEGFLATLEDARDLTPLYAHKMPVRQIISEEAEYYFNGSKSIEEVVEIINNRVNLYLQENR